MPATAFLLLGLYHSFEGPTKFHTCVSSQLAGVASTCCDQQASATLGGAGHCDALHVMHTAHRARFCVCALLLLHVPSLCACSDIVQPTVRSPWS